MFTIRELLECNSDWNIKAIGTKEIWDICKALRREDKKEIMMSSNRASYGMCIVDLVVHYEHPVYKITYKDKAVGIGGLYKYRGKGVIWLCFTPEYARHKLSFLRFSKQLLPRLLKAYGVLTNVVWTKNTTHVEYLNWLGATWTKLDDDFSVFELKGDESK